MEVEGPFADIGVGGSFRDGPAIAEVVSRVIEALGKEPLVFSDGPERIRRAAIVTGGGARYVSPRGRGRL